MRRNNLSRLGNLLAGTVSIYGCGSVNVPNNLCDREISEEVQEDLDARILEANLFYAASGGHEVGGFISLLDGSQGECSELRYICDNVRGRNFSYRWASKDNKELRGELCADYGKYLDKEYDEETAAVAMDECLDGIPALIY